MDEMPRAHFSYSQLSMFLRCPMQYRFRYVMGKIIRPNWSMVLGKNGHKTLGYNNALKIKSGTDIKAKEAQEHFSSVYDESTSLEDINFQKENEGSVKDKGIKVIGKYFDVNPSKMLQPKRNEYEIKFYIPEADIDLTAIVDVEFENDLIKDYKFSAKTPPIVSLFNNTQLRLYAMCLKAAYKRIPRVGLDYLIYTKEPKIKPYQPPITDIMLTNTYSDLVNIINQIKYSIMSDTFFRNSTSYSCSPDSCGYWDLCKPGEKTYLDQMQADEDLLSS